MIELVIRIPEQWLSGRTEHSLEASVQTDGYKVAADWKGWGRNRDGSIRLDLQASVTSPPGILAVLP
jgi:hypothetical protein